MSMPIAERFLDAPHAPNLEPIADFGTEAPPSVVRTVRSAARPSRPSLAELGGLDVALPETLRPPRLPSDAFELVRLALIAEDA